MTPLEVATVYAVLAAYTLGLLPSTASRLAQSSFFALSDTRTPARIAAVRLVVSALSGAALMWLCDRFSVAEVFALSEPGRGLHLGAVGLGLGSSLGAWCELVLLRRALEVSRRDPRNLLFLAEGILEYDKENRAEALALLRELAAREPDPEEVVEHSEPLEQARRLLEELEGR